MMDRGREARRSGGAERGGPVSAPRRPRTSGFKDASVGEDCDETMDDVHNPRLRERPKKDSNSLMSSGKGLVSSSVVSIPRFKRKRQGLHEIHEHVRSASIADEGEETTHDSEMGGSEDDDDLPPPTIPRRPAKSRPQQGGKGVEEMSVRNDLPTVPRKARSAVPKRAQESPPPPPAVEETPPPQPTPPIASPTPAPSSTLSSSSAVTLKPRRRTKPSGSKPKVPKLLKVSTPTVSEEVEVAEALFDLARTIPPALDRRIELKPESKPEAKSLPSASVQATSPAAQPSNGTAASSPVPPINNSPAVLTGPSPAAAPASPVPSPSPSSAAAPPPAEAPKRKRPRVRTRPEEGVPAAQAAVIANTVVVNSSIPVVAAPPIREVDPSEDHPVGITEEASLKTEVTTTTAPVSGPVPAASSPSASLPVAAPSMRQNSTVERKHEKAEMKVVKGEVTKTTFNEKKSSSAAPVDIKPAPIKLAAPTTVVQEVEPPTISSPLPVDSPNKKDVAKRSAQPAPAADDGRLNKFNIDLTALPSKAVLPVSSERNDNVTGMQVEEVQEKPLVDVSIAPPVVSGWIETAKEEVREQEQQGKEEIETEMPKEQEPDKERERPDLSKLPTQRASKSVKPESRPQKSEKASSAVGTSVAPSLLASTVASPLSTGMPGWPGVMPSLGYFPAAAGWPSASSTGASSADENPQARVSPFSNMPPQQPWKRCACHVWIAHFIDRQQQANRRSLFTAELYGGKSFNPNMTLPPTDPLYGSSGGGAQVAAVAGPSLSSVALLGVGERGLGGTTVSGAKERERIAAATFAEVMNQNSASQQQPPNLSLQAGTAFGYSGTQAGTVAMASSGSSAGVVNGVAAAANMGSGALTGSSSGPGTNSLAAANLGSAVGPGMVASNRVAVSTASVQEHYMHAMMQNAFPYHHYPGPHFGPPAFNGPPTHMGPQQAAAQYFASAPFFAQHLVPPSQQTSAHQTTVASGGGPVPLQKQQQQQGVRRFPPTGSPHAQQLPPQSPSPSSSLQQMQPQSEKDVRDGPSGGDTGSVAESKFLHRPPYSQGSSNTVIVAPASSQTLSSHQDFSMLAALGKQSNQREQQQQHVSAQQLQASQPQPSLSSQLQQQHQAHLQIGLKGLDPQASQAFSAMTMAAAMNRGPVGPGPLGLAPVAAVMAPQGHAMLQNMADAVRHPPQSPHHSSSSGTPHPSLIQQQQQQQQQQQRMQQHRQQQQQHRSVQMQRGPLAVDEGHIVADVSNYPTNAGGGRERDPGDDRKMSSKQPMGLSSPVSRVNLDGSPTRGNTRNVAPTLNLSASTSATLSTRPTGQVAQSGMPPSVAQASHTPKQSVRTKGITGPNTASSAASTQSNMASYTERGPLPAASLTAKASGPGLSLAGQTAIPSSQGARQTPIAQHSHLKLPQRTAMGSTPTAPGTDPKAVLAAAMAKVQNTQNQLQPSRSPQVAPRTGSPSQMSSAVSGPPASSSPAPLSPLTAGSKPSWSVGAKQGSSTKGSASFPTTQKSVGAASGKRNSSPSLSQHVILGPSPTLGNQNLSAKLPQQQQQQQQQQLAAQNSHPLPQQPQAPQQHAPPLQQQYSQLSQTHKQQNSQQQQPQPMLVRQHRQLFQQQQMQMFQPQQLPRSQSPPLPSPPPQHPPQLQQQPQHAPLTQAQMQQNLSHQRPLQHLSQQQQQSPSSLPGSVPNGGLSLASGAMSGSSNSSNVANSSRNSGAENIGVSQASNTRPAPSNFSASPLPGSGSLRGSSPSPAYLHPQFNASQGMTSSHPDMHSSIQHSNIPPSPQSASAVGGGGKPTDVKTSAELNSPEQLSNMRPLQVPASVKTSTSLSAASPSPSIPQPSVQPTGAPNQGKLSSGQFTGSNHGDNMLSRNSLMHQLVAPSSTVNSAPNHSPNNSISNGHNGSNVHPPLFAGSSPAVQQGTVNSSPMHPPSSLSMVAASVVPTGPASTVEP